MKSSAAETAEAVAIKGLRAWRKDPTRFVREAFKAEPDEWQKDFLLSIMQKPRVAVSACKGPGKSASLAWCIWWFLATNVDAQVIAISITSDNLKDNLWKELAFWLSKSPFLQAAFELNSERIVSRERSRTWWCSARSFARVADPTQQANTLAGFHGENIMVVLDELGDYPDGVLAAAEAIFANKVNAHLVVAGNPTRTDGPLYRVCTKDAASWHVIHITGDPDDPKRSPRIDIDWAREEIRKNGRDNPWVMVNILGLFPPAGSDQLISVNLVTLAMGRDAPILAYRSEARVWGLDPARFGDDEAVLSRRQGLVARVMIGWRNLDGTQLGDAVGRLIIQAENDNEAPDAIFVDVGGVGASAYDRLAHLGWDHLVHSVDFGGSPEDPRFLNKRMEIWQRMADWLKNMPACLPNDATLQSELPAPRYWFRVVNKRTAFVLESKDDMKKRGVPSPNRADALALTFTAPVARLSAEARMREQGASRNVHAVTDYDPYAERA